MAAHIVARHGALVGDVGEDRLAAGEGVGNFEIRAEAADGIVGEVGQNRVAPRGGGRREIGLAVQPAAHRLRKLRAADPLHDVHQGGVAVDDVDFALGVAAEDQVRAAAVFFAQEFFEFVAVAAVVPEREGEVGEREAQGDAAGGAGRETGPGECHGFTRLRGGRAFAFAHHVAQVAQEVRMVAKVDFHPAVERDEFIACGLAEHTEVAVVAEGGFADRGGLAHGGVVGPGAAVGHGLDVFPVSATVGGPGTGAEGLEVALVVGVAGDRLAQGGELRRREVAQAEGGRRGLVEDRAAAALYDIPRFLAAGLEGLEGFLPGEAVHLLRGDGVDHAFFQRGLQIRTRRAALPEGAQLLGRAREILKRAG